MGETTILSTAPRREGALGYGGLKTRSKLLIPSNPLVAHALMRAVFALLRTPVATEPKRSQAVGTRHAESACATSVFITFCGPAGLCPLPLGLSGCGLPCAC